MKIRSWNMLFSNKELDAAFKFIRDSEWDVFCLQEVPEEFLTKLRTLPVEMGVIEEAGRQLMSGRIRVYLVTLSRFPIVATKPIPLPYKEEIGSLREKAYVRAMSAVGLFTKRVGPRHFLYVDVTGPAGVVRIFNVHLSLQHPQTRLAEFETAMIERDSATPSIVCGDFNILESPHITAINFLRGGALSDAMLYTRERTNVEKRFFEYELTNALRGKKTHPFSRSQLDHILVSKSFSITNAEVVKDRYGSDHCPIRVEVT